MKKAFSLIELIVVIAITAVLLAVALPNLLSARERARDAKRKQEMNEMKNALRLYYNDFQHYPPQGYPCGNTIYTNYISGCGADHISCCACNTSVDFATGAACDAVYMKKFPSSFPTDPISAINYYSSGADDFCLKVSLENGADSDIATSQLRCPTTSACGNNCRGTKDYCVCAD